VSWEWVPIATAVSSLLGAAIGGWVGGRQSRKTQERQHHLEREREISTRGLEKADEAISALRFLQDQGRTVVDWRNPTTAHPYFEQTHLAHDVLGRDIEYLTDATVREQIATVHFLIGTAWIKRGGADDLLEALGEHLNVCDAGVEVLGRYLRNEPTKDLQRRFLTERGARERFLQREFDKEEQQRAGTQP
jgi:hypothetical protein